MNCPKCGAAPTNVGHTTWKCGSFSTENFFVSNLCQEREAHGETRRELEKWKHAYEDVKSRYLYLQEQHELTVEVYEKMSREASK